MKNEILISYVPSIHSEYLQFFRKHQGKVLYVLGSDFIGEFEHLGRDIRALLPSEAQGMIAGLNIFSDVHVLNEETLPEILGSGVAIVMPDEDVTRTIAKRYFSKVDIIFENIFLRWDMSNVTRKWDVSFNRQISVTQVDRDLMLRAKDIADRSPDFWRQVGALAVKNGEILFVAYNTSEPSEQTVKTLGDPRLNFGPGERFDLSAFGHAESAIIARAACSGISLRGAYLYVTTFPCPACAYSIGPAGFVRVYYSEGYSLIHGEDSLRKYDVEIIHVDLKK